MMGGEHSSNEREKVAVRATVFLVHGIWMTGLEMQYLARRLQRAGYRTRTWAYHSLRVGLRENAERLAEAVAQESGEVYLVGHSLGGLIAARAVCDHPGRTAKVRRMVALGSPFLGTTTGRSVARLPLGAWVTGRCFPLEEAFGSEGEPRAILPEWRGACELGILAGTLPLGIWHLLGLLPTPNDGIIALEETRLPGATEHRALHVSHLALAFHPTAVRQTLHFLAHGRFSPASAGEAGAREQQTREQTGTQSQTD